MHMHIHYARHNDFASRVNGLLAINFNAGGDFGNFGIFY
jgi:hypothetical protein